MTDIWPDIEKVALFDQTPAAVQNLKRLMERFDASRFLAGHTPYEWTVAEVDEVWKLRVKSWLNWAAIVALPSGAAGDPLHSDLADMGLGDCWLKSAEKRGLYADPLLAVLFELRNYEVHVELRAGVRKEFRTRIGFPEGAGLEPRDLGADVRTFISPIDFSELARLRNVRQGRSNVTANMVDWFNRQADTWPAAYLLGVARERFSAWVARFLERASIQ